MLEVAELHVHYGRAHILHGVSFDLARGQALALMGRNGAGKTTTLKAIMGLVRPSAGRVRFEGVDITGLEPYRIARLGIGWVPEERRIFKGLTVLENLEVGRRRRAADGEAWTIAQLFALFPNLAERRHHLGNQLSGGEQQMLAIARTLMGNPRLVLLDEPSEGLAPVIVDQLVAAVRAMKLRGVSILLSEQQLHFAAEVAERACILEKGTLCFDGPMTRLLEEEELRRAYLAV